MDATAQPEAEPVPLLSMRSTPGAIVTVHTTGPADEHAARIVHAPGDEPRGTVTVQCVGVACDRGCAS